MLDTYAKCFRAHSTLGITYLSSLIISLEIVRQGAPLILALFLWGNGGIPGAPHLQSKESPCSNGIVGWDSQTHNPSVSHFFFPVAYSARRNNQFIISLAFSSYGLQNGQFSDFFMLSLNYKNIACWYADVSATHQSENHYAGFLYASGTALEFSTSKCHSR